MQAFALKPIVVFTPTPLIVIVQSAINSSKPGVHCTEWLQLCIYFCLQHPKTRISHQYHYKNISMQEYPNVLNIIWILQNGWRKKPKLQNRRGVIERIAVVQQQCPSLLAQYFIVRMRRWRQHNRLSNTWDWFFCSPLPEKLSREQVFLLCPSQSLTSILDFCKGACA